MSESGTVTVKSLMQKDVFSRSNVEDLRRLVYGSEKNQKAIKNILSKLESIPTARRGHHKSYKLALLYWFVNRDEDAIKLLGKHLNSALSYSTYVAWCLTKELHSQASKKAKEGLKQFGNDFELKCLDGQASIKLGQLKDAEKLIEKLKKTLPPLDLEGLRAAREEFEESEDSQEAESGEEPEKLPQYPQHSNLLYLEGLLEEARCNWETALQHYDDSIVADTGNIFAYFRKAYNLDLRGMDEDAIETYEQARRLRPLRSNILFNLGILYEDHGKNRKALQCFKTILEDNPNHRRAKLFLEDCEASKFMYFDEEEEKEHDKLLSILNTPISDFELSVRSRNCLAKMNIKTLGHLSQKTEVELLSYKNFGETSLAEIKSLLSSKGLSLGMGKEDLLKKSKPEEEETDEGAESDASKPDLLNSPVASINLSVRCRRAVAKLGIQTLGELIRTPESSFQGIRNFGLTSLNEIKRKLAEYGLSLQPS